MSKLDASGRPKDNNKAKGLPIISSDMDGVWANWQQAILDIQTKKDGIVRDWKDWLNWDPSQVQIRSNRGDIQLLTKEQLETCFFEFLHTPRAHRTLDIYEGSTKIIRDGIDNGDFLCYFVTHRPNISSNIGVTDACLLTKQWLSDHGISNPTGVIAGHHNRTELLKVLGVDYHIDDYGEEFLRLREAGIKAYLIDRPWNKYINTPYRVSSFTEFLNKTVYYPYAGTEEGVSHA